MGYSGTILFPGHHTGLKYINLNTEIHRMWSMKRFVIPVITGATGIVTKSLKTYMETRPGKHSTDCGQKKKKKAALRTSHIKKEILQPETWSLSGGVHHWFMRSTRRKDNCDMR
jgi:hypothetical protein